MTQAFAIGYMKGTLCALSILTPVCLLWGLYSKNTLALWGALGCALFIPCVWLMKKDLQKNYESTAFRG